MVGSPGTVAVRSPARTHPKWTVLRRMRAVTRPRTSSPPAWPSAPKCRWRTRPVSLLVETFNTEKVPRRTIEKLVGEHFDLRPAAFRSYLRLHRPIYAKTAAYGHFGRDDPDFTWERTDKAAELREAAGLPASTEPVVASSGA